MSISPVITPEGHSGFYTAFGLSIAVILSPIIQSLIDLPISGLGPEIDSLLTITAISGLISGLLFVTSPDRIADIWVEGKAKYASWYEFSPIRKVKKCHPDLQRLIAEIDLITSNWDRATWVSTSESCFSVVESTTDAPQIQKTLWEMKRKASIGILFIMWSCSIWVYTTNLEIVWILLIVVSVGLSILFHTLFWGTSTEIVRRTRKYAFVSYAKDSLQSYQPARYGMINDTLIDVLDRIIETAKVVEQAATFGQWKRFMSIYENLLQVLENDRSRFVGGFSKLENAWIGAFADYYILKSHGENSDGPKNWFINVYEAYTITGAFERAHFPVKLNPDTVSDTFSIPDALFLLNIDNEVDSHPRVYKTYPSAVHRLSQAFFALNEKDKISWINAMAEKSKPFPRILRDQVYSFACDYEGQELVESVYVKLMRTPGDIRGTTFLMLERAYKVSTPEDGGKGLKFDFFRKITNTQDLDAELLEKARDYMSHFSP
ncbi:MAG: hypothetical protein ACFFF9_15765 [Candidatus Thorarchaeota archaeon]